MQHAEHRAGIYLMGLLAGAQDAGNGGRDAEALHGFDNAVARDAVLLVSHCERLQHDTALSRLSAGKSGDATGRIDQSGFERCGRPNLFAAHARQFRCILNGSMVANASTRVVRPH